MTSSSDAQDAAGDGANGTSQAGLYYGRGIPYLPIEGYPGKLIAIEGTVEGDLQAEKSVKVSETAHLKGNIHAPSVSIVEGAQFNGNIVMSGAKAAKSAPAPHRQPDTVRVPTINAASK